MSTSTPTRKPGINIRTLTVTRTQQLSPRMKRITLSGTDLKDYPKDSNAATIKIFIPTEPDARPIARTYTVRNYNPDTHELSIDFVLHDHDSPASNWAKNAQTGATLGISEPRGKSHQIHQLPDIQHYIFAGDESALPAISAMLEKLPGTTRAHAFIEIHPGEAQTLNLPENITLTYLQRPIDQAGHTTVLQDAITQLEWPEGNVFTYVAGEANAVVALRSFFREVKGLDKSHVYAVPFWKAGLNEEAYHQERHAVMDA